MYCQFVIDFVNFQGIINTIIFFSNYSLIFSLPLPKVSNLRTLKSENKVKLKSKVKKVESENTTCIIFSLYLTLFD